MDECDLCWEDDENLVAVCEYCGILVCDACEGTCCGEARDELGY